MNIKEYISSGIIESYVLGLASPEERSEFEALCRQYPELVEARNAFEIALEEQAFEGSVQPGSTNKQKIFDSLDKDASPAKVIPISTATSVKNNGWMKWAVAASLALLLTSAYFAFQFYQQNRELRAANDNLSSRINEVSNDLAKLAETNKMMSDPNVAVVSLAPMEKAPPSTAAIYWDSTSSHVYLVVKNMPQLPSDKQYQLWALINGQPKDLGLFDVKTNGGMILKMNDTRQADAFAITIEKRGNGSTPNGQMLNMGKTRL